jgi:hypothetical protein
MLTGMGVLPKKSALTAYSYRLAHDHQQRFLAALDTTMIDHGLASSDLNHPGFAGDSTSWEGWGHDEKFGKLPEGAARARGPDA